MTAAAKEHATLAVTTVGHPVETVNPTETVVHPPSMVSPAASESTTAANAAEAASPSHLQIHLPAVLPARLAIKRGVPLTDVRCQLGPNVDLELHLDQGYDALRAKILEALQGLDCVWVEDESPILVKPTANATQRDYVALTPEGFLEQITDVFWQAPRRARETGKFVLPVFVYVQVPNAPGSHHKKVRPETPATATNGERRSKASRTRVDTDAPSASHGTPNSMDAEALFQRFFGVGGAAVTSGSMGLMPPTPPSAKVGESSEDVSGLVSLPIRFTPHGPIVNIYVEAESFRNLIQQVNSTATSTTTASSTDVSAQTTTAASTSVVSMESEIEF